MTPIRKLLGTLCDRCPLCNYARAHPDSVVAKYYVWHGKWCPAWKAQQEIQAARDTAARKATAESPGQPGP